MIYIPECRLCGREDIVPNAISHLDMCSNCFLRVEKRCKCTPIEACDSCHANNLHYGVLVREEYPC